MASILSTLRQAVYDHLELERQKETFVTNSFDLQQTYLPRQALKDLTYTGTVWIIGLASDDFLINRAGRYQKDIPIQVALQAAISDPDNNIDEIDTFVQLEEELRYQVSQVSTNAYGWFRTESLKDENETPFAFAALRDTNTFEAYFTAYFRTVYPR